MTKLTQSIVGMKVFRYLTRRHLRELREVLLVEEWSGKPPLAAVIPYELYMEMQTCLIEADRLMKGEYHGSVQSEDQK